MPDPVFLITGASTGIGAATAAPRRARPATGSCSRRARRTSSRRSPRSSAAPSARSRCTCDVTEFDQQEAMVAAALDAFGRIDVVFANAGFGAKRGFLEETPEQWRAMVLTNVLGCRVHDPRDDPGAEGVRGPPAADELGRRAPRAARARSTARPSTPSRRWPRPRARTSTTPASASRRSSPAWSTRRSSTTARRTRCEPDDIARAVLYAVSAAAARRRQRDPDPAGQPADLSAGASRSRSTLAPGAMDDLTSDSPTVASALSGRRRRARGPLSGARAARPRRDEGGLPRLRRAPGPRGRAGDRRRRRASDAARARVAREAQVTGRLGDHPNVITVYDTGEHDGVPYLVLRAMSGGSLADAARARARRASPTRSASAREIAAALAHAHAHGVVHRDVKPDNVWLAADGSAALGDFGIAHLLGAERLTAEGVVVGTVRYLSPEQIRGERGRPRERPLRARRHALRARHRAPAVHAPRPDAACSPST